MHGHRTAGVVPVADRARAVPRSARTAYGVIQPKEQSMNENQIKGEWNVMRGKVAEKWGKLTNDDLEVIKGQRTQLVGLLQQRYGKAQAAVEREVKEFEISVS